MTLWDRQRQRSTLFDIVTFFFDNKKNIDHVVLYFHQYVVFFLTLFIYLFIYLLLTYEPCSVKGGLMHLRKVPTHVSLRSPRRLIWVDSFRYPILVFFFFFNSENKSIPSFNQM